MLRDRKGMALVLTLLAISFMVAVTVQLGSSVNWQMQAAVNQSDLVQLDAMLLSGLHLARAALLADQRENQHDSAFDRWGTFDAEALAALFPNGKVDIHVTDMSGLLQMNALVLTAAEKKKEERKNKKIKDGQGKKIDKENQQRELWLRFFKNAGLDDEEKQKALLNCLIDWIDENDDELDNGAERTYYSSQSPPYSPANKPVTLLEELHLIKGWDKLLRVKDDDDGGSSEEAKKAATVIQYVTATERDGKININTAPAPVLQVMHEDMNAELAAKLIEFRQDEANKDKLEQADWYKQVSGFPGDVVFDQALLTVRSHWFKVTVTAELKELRRSGEGIIRRMDNQEQELLWWKAE